MVPKKEVFFRFERLLMRLECPVYGFTNKHIVFLDRKLFLGKFFLK